MPLKRVLITHPDERGGERFSSSLVRSGQFVVKTAHDGFTAALLLVRETYDAILLHPRTPGMDVRRAISEIRGQTSSKGAGIIVILGQMDDPDRSVLRRTGVMDFCSEREEAAALITKVEAAAGVERKPPVSAPASGPASASLPPVPKRQIQPTPPGKAPSPSVKRASGSTPPSPKVTASAGTEDPERGKVPAHLQSRPIAPQRMPARNRPTVTMQDRMSGHLSLVAREGTDLVGFPPRVSRLDFLIPDMRGDLVSKEVLAIDLSLAVLVLRMANSVTFGTRSPILGLGRALTRLGQRTLATQFLDRWKARQEVPFVAQGFLLGHAWRHNLMVACLAEEISRHTRQGAPDAYFSAGLLHDVGKLLMVQHYPDEFLDIRHRRRTLDAHADDAAIRQTERSVVGVDHGMLGYELCQAWSLPSVVSVGTLHHHVGTDGPWMKLHPRVTSTVAVANLIDHHVERIERPRNPLTDEAFEVVPETGDRQGPAPGTAGHSLPQDHPAVSHPARGGGAGRSAPLLP